jgi:hypothetical protein
MTTTTERIWTEDGFYHEPKGCHPHGCRGCNSDSSKWGKPYSTSIRSKGGSRRGTHKAVKIARILDNPVYSPESGLRMQLAKALESLSLVSLGQLEVIINCKDHAVRLV